CARDWRYNFWTASFDW
nr:immunoglobulin heavy chain junction region [Macaca mulatta]